MPRNPATDGRPAVGTVIGGTNGVPAAEHAGDPATISPGRCCLQAAARTGREARPRSGGRTVRRCARVVLGRRPDTTHAMILRCFNTAMVTPERHARVTPRARAPGRGRRGPLPWFLALRALPTRRTRLEPVMGPTDARQCVS